MGPSVFLPSDDHYIKEQILELPFEILGYKLYNQYVHTRHMNSEQTDSRAAVPLSSACVASNYSVTDTMHNKSEV